MIAKTDAHNVRDIVVDPFRVVAAACAICALAVASAGCGGGAGSKTIANVDGEAITQSELDHWIAVVARRQYEAMPRGPIPAGVVPDPPRYAACASFLRTNARGPRAGNRTRQSLARECAQQYNTLRELALDSLITGYWLIDEGKARGFKVTSAETSSRVAGIVQRDYGGERKFKRYLQLTGETLSDQRFRARIKLFSAKIERQLLTQGKGGQAQVQAYARFVEQFPKTWVVRTTCSRGYVVPNCREYHGPLKPEAKLL